MKSRKLFHKFCAVFVSVCMLASMLPTVALAATDPVTLNWVKIPEPAYKKVTTMATTEAGYEGFVIASAGSTAESNNFLYTDGSSGTAMVQSIGSSGVPQLWFWDEGRIYCEIDGVNNYLVSWYTSPTELGVNGFYPAHIALTQVRDQATVWTVEVANDQTHIYRTNGSEKHYLYLTPLTSNGTVSYNASLIKNADQGVDIYAHHEHSTDQATGYAALEIGGPYSYTTGEFTAQEILEQIYNTSAVWVADKNNSNAAKTDWSNSRITLSWDNALNGNYPGTYIATVKYGVMELGKISVSVTDKTATGIHISTPKLLNTALNVSPNFASVQATITYDDSSTAVVSGQNLVFNTETMDLSKTGVYPVEVSYHGHIIDTIFVRVSGDPYSHLADEGISDIPEFPNPGAVRWNKTASGLNYENTGVAQVELTVSGVSKPGNVDVVLVVDVSNSMGWSMDWFNGMSDSQVMAAKDNKKIPANGIYGTTKLDIAMDAATEFADILLNGNQNNTLSFVTFAGQEGSTTSNIDSVHTVFTGVTNYNAAKTAFDNTEFTGFEKAYNSSGQESGSVTYRLKITNHEGAVIAAGVNRGNTNYDYAFGQAAEAVASIKGQYDDYDATGRQLYVVFMTDGAPSHYNGHVASHQDNANDHPWNNPNAVYEAITGSSSYVYDSWTQWILKHNDLAEALAAQVDGFYPIGFDLAHGGFGVHSWDVDVMENVLRGLVSDTEDLDVTMANDPDALHITFREMANRFAYAGTSANVMDAISSDFTLYTGTESKVNDANQLCGITNEITVKSYELYTRDDIGKTINGQQITEAHVGTRKTDANGQPIFTVVERVSFNTANGVTTATSNLLNGENILYTDGDTLTIAGVYFTYTKINGVEKFDWNIGTITDHQIALCYNVYLKGSFDGSTENRPEDNIYPTNESAYLDFVSMSGRHAHRVFPVPKLPWGKASVTVRFYLVNNSGQYVNHAGVSFTEKANRVFLNESISSAVPLASADSSELSTLTKTAEEVYIAAGLGKTTYTLYSLAANSEFRVANSTTGTGSASHSEALSPDRIFIWGTDQTMRQAYVEIPVVMNDLPTAAHRLFPKQIVIDYGKSVEFPTFVAGELPTATGDNTGTYTMSVVGFAPYNATHTQEQYVPSDAFAPTFRTPYGYYEIVGDGTAGEIRFTPTAMLDKVEKIFVAVKFQHTAQSTNYYYMFKEVDIIPATIMYYETDFADGVFRTVGQWSTVPGSPTADEPQDDKVIGTDLYGYDSSYTDDINLSNGSSLLAKGDSPDGEHPTTYATFNFTGTGFEIISRTGEQEGLIVVTVTKHIDGHVLRTFKVLNKSERALELYQVPVVSMNDLPYGSYTVTIDVIQGFKLSDFLGTTASALDRGNQFHFDAVRIYNPLLTPGVLISSGNGNTYATTSNMTADGAIAYEAYVADGEAHAQVIEVRNELIDSKTYGGSTDDLTTIDRHDQGALVLNGSAKNGFESIGPNNEVYLSGTQVIGLALDFAGTLPESIHISAKSADGTPAKLFTRLSTADALLHAQTVNIESSTAQCFDVIGATPLTDGTKRLYLTISNKGDGILSITDLQIAYGTKTPGTAGIARGGEALTALSAKVADHRAQR